MAYLRLKAFIAASFGAPLLAFAAPDPNSATLGITPTTSGGTGPFSQFLTQPGAISISGSATGGDAAGLPVSGSGSTFVDYGVIKLQGTSTTSLDTVARGIFRDNITITAPGIPNGTLGTLTYAVSLTGALSATPGLGTQAGWLLQTNLGGGAFDMTHSGRLNGQTGFSGDPFGVFTATGHFQYGFAAPIDVELTGSAQTRLDLSFVSGTATFDLAHSLYWAGLSDVRDNAGNLVTTFSISSDSGVDWTRSLVPVPEPSSQLLFCFGLAGLGICQSRRT